MNSYILNNDIQIFINENLNTDISKLLFKKQLFSKVSNSEIVEQIEAKKRCKKKLPTWFNCKFIYYPNKLNIEQTSSELTANYKSNLVSGNELIDLTGGFGVDSFYFSKTFSNVIHCEINEELSKIVKHNFKLLNANNIEVINENGITYLNARSKKYDCIYVDPSRRHNTKGKVFFLKDCEPNIVKEVDSLFNFSDQIIVKASPMLDISVGISELICIEQIHIIAVKNEVKELLFVLKKDTLTEPIIHTININKGITKKFSFNLSEERESFSVIDTIKKYLYEPNAAIMKAGAFNSISLRFNLEKLNNNSHLYTSNDLIDFPGRVFKIDEVLIYNKKTLKKRLQQKQFNVVTRNFPISPEKLKQMYTIKEGKSNFVYFTQDKDDKKIVLLCTKIS